MRKIIITAIIVSVAAVRAYAANGEAIYAKCKACHGANGEKQAMGTGDPLKGQSADDIVTKLNGYKDGSYGGSKKAIMSSQAGRLSDEEIKAVAEYISKF